MLTTRTSVHPAASTTVPCAMWPWTQRHSSGSIVPVNSIDRKIWTRSIKTWIRNLYHRLTLDRIRLLDVISRFTCIRQLTQRDHFFVCLSHIIWLFKKKGQHHIPRINAVRNTHVYFGDMLAMNIFIPLVILYISYSHQSCCFLLVSIKCSTVFRHLCIYAGRHRRNNTLSSVSLSTFFHCAFLSRYNVTCIH